MTDDLQTAKYGPVNTFKRPLFLALPLYFFLYGAFFYNLVKEQHSLMLARQTAFESMKILGIPGTVFLQQLGVMTFFSASLFYLVLLGLMVLVFLLFSLRFQSLSARGVYLGIGLVGLGIITFQDRVNLSFMLVSTLSFGAFYLLTLRSRIAFSLTDSVAGLCMMVLLSLSLAYGANHWFFLKLRDRALFGNAIGSAVVSFYYRYSPLATGPITPARGIHQGLIFDENIKDGKAYYVVDGVFAAGNKSAEAAADFTLTRDGETFSLTSRQGRRVALKELSPSEIEQAISRLFDMRGLLRLSSAALYFFPAGVLILCLLVLRVYTLKRKPFLLFCAGLTLILLSFIWYVTLTGNRPPSQPPATPESLSRQGLPLAYYLFQQKQVPAAYVPAIRWMIQSESEVLRYWGANLLGMRGDKGETQRLIGLLEDASPNVRYTACISLYKLLKQESFQYLAPRLLTDTSWYVRCRVYSIFLKAGSIPSPA
ncbi:MAG: HEAT repeat domain-containing protein [Thermodesulfobacteriota bacterium]